MDPKRKLDGEPEGIEGASMADDKIAAAIVEWRHVRPELDVSGMARLQRIGLAGTALRRLAELSLAGLDVDFVDSEIVTILRRQPSGVSVTNLVPWTPVTQAAVSSRLTRLELRGYIRRDATGDGRSRLVRLTSRGRALADRLMDHRVAMADGLLADLDQNQLDVLDAVLREVERRASQSIRVEELR